MNDTAKEPVRSMKISGSGVVAFAKEGETNPVAVKGGFSGDKKNISVYFSEACKDNLLARSLQLISSEKQKIAWPFQTESSDYECTAVVKGESKNLVCTIDCTSEEKADKVLETLAKDSALRKFI